MNQFFKKFLSRWQTLDPTLRMLLLGMVFLGVNQGILSTAFNNYLYDMFSLDAPTRGTMEFPRELPGFSLIFVTGLLAVFSMRSWAMIVGILSAIGVMGLGFFSPTLTWMTLWMIFWSLADHLFMPVEGSLGLKLARKNSEGQRLGQLSAARNLAMIGGSGLVALIAWQFPGNYKFLFSIAAVMAIISMLTFRKMKVPVNKTATLRRFVFHWRYKIYYYLNILFGARKQIFLTFGPWVLVSIHGTKPETIGVLIMVASTISVFFRQAFGMLADKYGERNVLCADALIFLGICLGYALSSNVYLLYILYVTDSLMFASRIARTTYLNKISVDKSEIAPTISLGVTLDHAVSMTVPILGGIIWDRLGFQAVFLLAGSIAVMNFFVAIKIAPQLKRPSS